MTKKVPEILYKYRNTCDRTISMLEKDEIYFANPTAFNDPFDCKGLKNQARYFRESMENFLRTLDAKMGFSDEKIEALISEMNQHPEMIQNRVQTDHHDTKLKQYSENDLEIVSLSSCNNSILMWSHYANFHRGFCIGYNTAKHVYFKHGAYEFFLMLTIVALLYR